MWISPYVQLASLGKARFVSMRLEILYNNGITNSRPNLSDFEFLFLHHMVKSDTPLTVKRGVGLSTPGNPALLTQFHMSIFCFFTTGEPADKETAKRIS
jgi:hypothetical protein